MNLRVLAIADVVIKELYRRKDFYVLFILTALITLVAGSINIFQDDRIIRYLKEVCLLLIWVSALVVSITTAARQIPSERENRTLFPLLAKPVSRWEVILGKFFGCWFASGIALILFYLFFGVVCSTREQDLPIASYLQAFGLHWFMLAVVVAMTLLGSVALTTPSANVTICFVAVTGILLFGRHLANVAAGLPDAVGAAIYAMYYLIPHLEFFDIRDIIIHRTGLVPWWAVVLALLYATAYTLAFLLGAWMVFRRKSLN